MLSNSADTPASRVLEVGGTHVTAAVVEHLGWSVRPDSVLRLSLPAAGNAEEIVNRLLQAASALDKIAGLTVAIPDPFDYEQGIGQYRDVGKFEALAGFDLRTALCSGLNLPSGAVSFINDADAFGIGEYAVGAASGYRRAVCITLGTGVGSVFLDEGVPVKTGPAVPPMGTAHRVEYQGRPLEETTSRRAIRAAYAAAVGPDSEKAGADVHDIASWARGGDRTAAEILERAFTSLGEALGEYIDAFQAGVLVVGGSMSRSWDLVAPALRAGLVQAVPGLKDLTVRPAQHPEMAPLSGAACWSAWPAHLRR